jgi:hypothetical protein
LRASWRVLLLAAPLLALLPVALLADDPIPLLGDPETPPPPSSSSTPPPAPDRALLEYSAETPSGTLRLSLFSNRLAILKSTDRDGRAKVEHRLLSAEEVAVYGAQLERLLQDPGPEGKSEGCTGDLMGSLRVRITSASGAVWSWRWCELVDRPLAAAQAEAYARDIADSIRNKRKIEDPWRDAPPALDERLVREDGGVWRVVAVDTAQDFVELASVDQPVRLKLKRARLHELFILERTELELAPPAKSGGEKPPTQP